MKIVGSASLLLLGTATQAEALQWTEAWESLSSCLTPAGHCIVEGGVISGQFNSTTCTGSGYEWRSAFESADAFTAAAVATEQRYASEGTRGLYLVPITKGESWYSLSQTLPVTVVPTETLAVCEDGPVNWGKVDGFPADVRSIFGDAAIALPDKLKLDAWMSQRLRTAPAVSSRSGNSVVERAVLLAPHAAQRVRSVIESWKEKHQARRRMLSGDAAANEFEVHLHGYAVGNIHQRRALEYEDEEISTVKQLFITSEGPTASEDDLSWIVSEPEVEFVSDPEKFLAFNGHAALISHGGVNVAANGAAPSGAENDRLSPIWAAGIKGKGQVIGVGDSGLDTLHPLFTDTVVNMDPGQRRVRVNQVYNSRKVANYFPFIDTSFRAGAVDHGTHVAGSVAGNVQQGSAAHKGMAPDAKISFFDISQDGQSISPPNDLGAMFTIAKNAGAAIHTNSWGAATNSYSPNCAQADRFLFENQEFLVLFAAGNSGPGPRTVGNPGTAKNVMTVGASLNADGSWARLNRVCPSTATPGQCIEGMASFSSTGPTFDGRIKPDVSAPGDKILSASSGTAGLAALSGTSMATPITAGNAALVRQFLMEGRHPKGNPNSADAFVPMGALVKALMIDSADVMTGDNSAGQRLDRSGKPNQNTGFGRVNLGNTLMVNGNGNSPNKRKVYLDGNMANMPVLAKTGDTLEYKISVLTGVEVRATMAYYDAPGTPSGANSLVNDVDVVLVDPSGKSFFPNGLAGPDAKNTVEQIKVPAAQVQSGTYTLKVSARAINAQAQPFAVVLSGGIDGSVPGGNDVAPIGAPSANEKLGNGGGSSILPIAAAGGGLIVLAAGYFLFSSKQNPNSNVGVTSVNPYSNTQKNAAMAPYRGYAPQQAYAQRRY